MRFMVIISLFALSACSSKKLIRDDEYVFSLNAARNGNFEKALDEFPKKEHGGFITSLEKNWLGFWVDQTDLKSLQKQIQTFDERKFISISREAEYFFYQESEDGYIPSEHEVIILHLLSAQIYLKQGLVEQAQVELRRANYLFSGLFTQHEKHFDDPALRIWQGTLWAATGSWQDAQVDFRRAYELTQNNQLLSFLKMERPPKYLNLTFKGIGPQLEWQDSSPEPLFQKINSSEADLTFNSNAWYERHLQRNHAVRDVLLKSNYMTQFLGIKSQSATQKVATYSFATTVKIVGVVAATAIIAGAIYIAANAGVSSNDGLGYLAVGGYSFGAYMWRESDYIQNRNLREIKEEERQQFLKLRTYRFVRFLPSEISLSTKPDSSGIILKSPTSPTSVILTNKLQQQTL
jgi:hypothetical protein